MKSEIFFGLCLLGLGLAGCGAAPEKNTAPDAKPSSGATPKTPAFVLTSSAFEANGDIPVRYTCDGEDISPPLTWRGAPEGTQNFVLIVDDPDAPLGTFTHWVLFDLPAERSELAEGASSDGALSALHGKTSFGKTAYGGPCPPSGVHHYIFTLYAVDTQSGLPAGASKKQVLAKLEGHILGQAELTGLYSRQ